MPVQPSEKSSFQFSFVAVESPSVVKSSARVCVTCVVEFVSTDVPTNSPLVLMPLDQRLKSCRSARATRSLPAESADGSLTWKSRCPVFASHGAFAHPDVHVARPVSAGVSASVSDATQAFVESAYSAAPSACGLIPSIRKRSIPSSGAASVGTKPRQLPDAASSISFVVAGPSSVSAVMTRIRS